MRLVLILAILAVTIFAEADQLAKSATHRLSSSTSLAVSLSPANKPDFDSDIKPIFQARCQPCHFEGGKMYAEMPFDKPETIHRLGTKLFTRIRDEKERARIREFLGQP
jgi:hypothetical protein